MNKKKITAVLLALLLLIVYLFSGKIANKFYLRGYEKDKIQGENRYETMISCGEGYWDDPKEAILINTNHIASAMNAVPYAYANNMPLLLTEKEKLPPEIYSFIKKSGLKKIYIIGGISSVSRSIERVVERAGIKVERIITKDREDISNYFAELTVKKTKSKEMFVIFDGKNGYSIGVSILGKAAEKGMPILTVNESNLYKAAEFARENGIEKTYVIGRFDDINSTVDKVLPNVHRISGKDKFEVNRNVIEEFYDMDKVDKVYVVKGGTLIHGKTLNIGEFVNSISAVPRIVKTGYPILINDTSYLQKDTMKFIKKYDIKKLCSIGFEIQNTKFIRLDEDLSKKLSSIVLVFMIILITFRALKV
ncbi:cell wall-binding repeat-containing protein [Peptacetobacter hiranonis]|uniref:cell wall-binding repeat-containing protein n=1 Tax=Peptacetobacter hiranonis TaxID=89152 RepID=UPI002E76E712|nr:cell wall-binding repeat-containing protein [Peptacetobacter hiranonis]MEE0248483.1 cell wall-binding repeat-containing protein [Peptacetobacter hiranonis]